MLMFAKQSGHETKVLPEKYQSHNIIIKAVTVDLVKSEYFVQ